MCKFCIFCWADQYDSVNSCALYSAEGVCINERSLAAILCCDLILGTVLDFFFLASCFAVGKFLMTDFVAEEDKVFIDGPLPTLYNTLFAPSVVFTCF